MADTTQCAENPDKHKVTVRCYLCGTVNRYDGYWVRCPNRCSGSPSAHYGTLAGWRIRWQLLKGRLSGSQHHNSGGQSDG